MKENISVANSNNPPGREEGFETFGIERFNSQFLTRNNPPGREEGFETR